MKAGRTSIFFQSVKCKQSMFNLEFFEMAKVEVIQVRSVR